MSQTADPTNVTRRVALFTAALVAVGLLVFVVSQSVSTTPALPVSFPAWLLLGLFALSSTNEMVIEVGEHNHGVALTDIPLVVALFSTQRSTLLFVGLSAWFVSTIFNRWTVPLKIIFNLAIRFIEYALAIAIFDAFSGELSLQSPWSWLRTILAVITATTCSAVGVTVVIRLANGPSDGEMLRNIRSSFGNSILSTALALSAMIMITTTKASLALLLLLSALVIIPTRKLNALRRKHTTLQQLHDFSRALSGSSEIETTLHNILIETAASLRVDIVTIQLVNVEHEIVALSSREDAFALHVDDLLWHHLRETKAPMLLERGAKDFDNYLESKGAKDLMAIPLLHDHRNLGVLSVWNRVGEVSTFDADDLTIFTTMANQVTVTLKNLDLIDKLRDEASVREYQALHDDLTGLPNRSHLYQVVDKTLSDSSQTFFAMAICDLNRFKEVNDSLGHHAGDQVLNEAARRLRNVLPSSAFVARLGGDEFAVLFRGEDSVSAIGLRLMEVQDAFAAPFHALGIRVQMGISIGVATYPDDSVDRIGLLKLADIAMYTCKADRAGSQVRFYDPSQQQTSARQLTLLADLRLAIDNDDIEVVFQPKATMSERRVVGVEALARWRHPTFGEISPDEFIPLAENSGLMFRLTEHILRRSAAAIQQWSRAGFPLSVAVNVDAGTMSNDRFVDRVLTLLGDYGVAASSLTIELTERDLVAQHDSTSEFMEKLRDQGVRISIDDFGTGYSSLSYLMRLPVDELKIDRSFIIDVAASKASATVVQAIITMARGLGLETVVEGIEDEQTWESLALLGCDNAQGYLLSRPLDADALATWLCGRHDSRHESLCASQQDSGRGNDRFLNASH
jgi:diguanylate cyclase (GGDEF)-like protein